MDEADASPHKCGVLTKNEFLDRVLALASQAEIARTIGKPPSRVNELYLYRFPAPAPKGGEKPKKPRDLKYDEARALAIKYGIEVQPRTAEQQKPVAEPLSESELADLLFVVLSKQAFGETPLRELARTLAHTAQKGLPLSHIGRTKDRIRDQRAQAENLAAIPPRAAKTTEAPRSRRTQRDKGGSRGRT